MKFVCLGYGEEKIWDAMSKTQQDAIIEECFAYDDELLSNGHWIDGGQALQSSRTAKTLRWNSGNVVVTDGPFAETKEQLGGVGVLEARDMDHAIELVSKHPGLRHGFPFEIRPVDEETLQRILASDAKYASEAPSINTDAVKFSCLGYIDEADCDAGLEGSMDAMMAQCIAFDEARRKAGEWLGGIALQDVSTAKTVRSTNGKVLVTDGPYAETKEWLGGFVVLGLKDISHAIELLSTHPGLRFGVTIEARPIDDETNARWEARQDRFQRA